VALFDTTLDQAAPVLRLARSKRFPNFRIEWEQGFRDSNCLRRPAPQADTHPASVLISVGALGSGSILDRNWPMKTRRDWVIVLVCRSSHGGQYLPVSDDAAGALWCTKWPELRCLHQAKVCTENAFIEGAVESCKVIG
jgi:hypothetical protein